MQLNKGLECLNITVVQGSKVQVINPKARDSNYRTKEERKKRVCAYCRVSTEAESQATSFDLQVSYYSEFINKNPAWIFQAVYADEGISGTSTKNRTQFLKMIQNCLDGNIDYIITKSISRFARNTLDCLQYIRQLKNLPKPVGVYFEKENIDTLDSKSELILTILSSIAQDESRSISENAKWGVQKRFQQGKAFCPTKAFLGYDTDENDKIVINEEEAKIVRRVYKEFLAGNGTNVIARHRREDGVLTARKNPNWTGNAVFWLLTNEKYCGDILMQKSVTLDFLTHKRVTNKNHQPQYFVQDHHPAIISKDDWYAVQEEMKRRSQLLHDPGYKYKQSFSGKNVFSNKFFCAECGRPAVRRRLPSQRNCEKYHFNAWQCRVAAGVDKEYKGCHSRYIWESALEKAFMNLLYDMKRNREGILEDAKRAIEDCQISDMESNRILELESQYVAISAQLSEMAANAYSANGDLYEAMVNQLNYEQGLLQVEWEKLMKRKQESIGREKQLQALVVILDGLIEEDIDLEFSSSTGKPTFRDDVFLQIIERGIMHHDGLVDLEFKCGIRRAMKARIMMRSKA